MESFQLSIPGFTVWQKAKFYSERKALHRDILQGLTRCCCFQCCISRALQYNQKFKTIFMCSESSHSPPALLVGAVSLSNISPAPWGSCPHLSAWHLHCRMLHNKQISLSLFWGCPEIRNRFFHNATIYFQKTPSELFNASWANNLKPPFYYKNSIINKNGLSYTTSWHSSVLRCVFLFIVQNQHLFFRSK